MPPLTQIAGTCKDDDCPKIFLTNRNTVVIQGGSFPDGAKEIRAEIPMSVFLEAARALED